MKKVTRVIYILSGLSLIGVAIFIIINDSSFFTRFIANPQSYVPKVETEAFLASILMGLCYLYYSIKSDKINRVSTASIIILVSSLLLSFILFFGFNCFNYIFSGLGCPSYYLTIRYVAELLMRAGPLVSILLLISSFFIKMKPNILS